MRILAVIPGLLLCALSAAQANSCLLAQPLDDKGVIPDFINPLATEMDKVGKLVSVTYGMSEPIIRNAVNDGKIPPLGKISSLREATEVTRMLGLGYLIWIEPGAPAPVSKGATKSLRGVRAVITMYKGGKKIWSDDQTIGVSVGGADSTLTTVQALCFAFADKISKGPIKDLPRLSTKPIEDPGKGQAPIIPEGLDDDPELNDFAAILQRVKELINSDRAYAAEMLLRDAVDAAPKEGVRRRELISFLQSQNRVDEAIAITISSSKSLGDPTLTPLAARILLDAGRAPEALSILNDALVSNPNSAAIRIMLAEVRLRESSPEQALKHLELAIKAEPIAEAFGLRSLCRALLGAEDGSKLDMDRVRKDAPALPESLYARWAAIFDAALSTEPPDLRSLFQKVVLNRKSEEVADTVDAQERLAKACISFLGENPANVRYEKSHANRLLAMNLLIQSMSEIRTYIAKGDEDALSEARIDFGEMLKALEAAKSEFAKESKDGNSFRVDRDVYSSVFDGIFGYQGPHG